MTSDQNDYAHCLSMFEKLSEYIDNELDTATIKNLERHLQTCLPCKICLETLKRTVNLCRTMDTLPVPQSVSTKLKALTEDWVTNKRIALNRRQ